MARVFDVKLLAADPYVNAIELSYLGARKGRARRAPGSVGFRRCLLPSQ
jgi:hypothetical protein